MHKKTFYMLAVLLVISLAFNGCTAAPDKEDSDSEEAALTVVTTIFPPYDFTREVAGDLVDLTMLLPPGSESHSYEPSPQDVIRIQNCDVFIYGGGDSDWWVTEILGALDETDMVILTMMDIVDVVEEEIVEGMQSDDHGHDHEDDHDDHDEDEDHDHEEGYEREREYDEHVWTSPKNAGLIAAAIAETLIELDPENAGLYEANTAEFIERLDRLDQQFREVVEQATRTTLVFGDRFPFRYFVDEYSLTYSAAFPGCSTESDANPATIAYLIDKVRDEEIPVVFYIEFSNEKMADIICEEAGAKKLQLHSCHNVTRDQLRSGVTYLELMEQNLTNLKEALL